MNISAIIRICNVYINTGAIPMKFYIRAIYSNPASNATLFKLGLKVVLEASLMKERAIGDVLEF